MKRLLFLFCSMFFLITACSTSKKTLTESKKQTKRYSYINESMDTIVTVPLLTVKNDKIYGLLDSIINFNKSCIYFYMGEKVWFDIVLVKEKNDTLQIHLNAFQYWENDKYSIDNKKVGGFYYKNFLFVVEPFKEQQIFNDFFEQTNTFIDIITSYSNTVVYLIQPCKTCYDYVQFSIMVFDYMDDKFVLNRKFNNCTEYYPIYHRIRKNDTMKEIISLYGVNQNQIIKLNNLNKPILPTKGKIKIQ